MNNSPKLSKAYEDDARLWTLVSRAYYVSTNPTTNEPGLFYKELHSLGALSAGQELTGGVETMKLLYGTDSTGTGVAERYLPPADVSNWTKVMSARLGFVVRPPESVDTDLDTRTYDVLTTRRVRSTTSTRPTIVAVAGCSTLPYASAITRVRPCDPFKFQPLRHGHPNAVRR